MKPSLPFQTNESHWIQHASHASWRWAERDSSEAPPPPNHGWHSAAEAAAAAAAAAALLSPHPDSPYSTCHSY